MKHFKNLFLLIAMLIAFNFVNAQNSQLKLWSAPPYQIAFNPYPVAPAILPNADYGGWIEQYASNSMHDKNGNLLFFVVDDYVYDAQGYQIDRFVFNTVFSQAMGGEISIVPNPANCKQYYIIYTAYHTFQTGLSPFYAILDMSVANIYYPSLLGKLTYFNSTSNVFGLHTISPTGAFTDPVNSSSERFRLGIAVTPLRSGTNDHFLYIRGFSGNIERFLINASGITWGSTIDCQSSNLFNGIASDGGSNTKYPEMEIVKFVEASTTYYRLGFVYGNRQIGIVKLDYTTGNLFSTPALSVRVANVPPPGSGNVAHVKGLEFSPNGNYIYYTCKIWDDVLSQYLSEHDGFADLTQPTLTAVELLLATGICYDKNVW